MENIMGYTKAAILEINNKYAEKKDSFHDLLLTLANLNRVLKNKKAQEYLMQGAGRRIKILSRCIDNVFKIFPLEKKDLLSSNELADLTINLHAFFVNTSGIFDNLGWIFVHENNLFGKPKEGKINKLGVGLFNEKTQEHLNQKLKAYLTSERTQTWYNDYSKNYRDALAHRIPLYVPPAGLTDDEVAEYQTL